MTRWHALRRRTRRAVPVVPKDELVGSSPKEVVVTSVEGLAAHRRCAERIERAWPAFLHRRQEHLVQADRFGSAPEKATEQILAALFSDVLDWPAAHVNYQLKRADIVLTSPGVRWVIVEAKRPGWLAWHRSAIEAALTQACRYADEQKVHSIAISDGHVLYAADRVSGGLRDRLFVNLASTLPPADLWWLSVHGVYRARDNPDGAQLRLLPEGPADVIAAADAARADDLLHPKYHLPAHCFAYVGNAAEPSTWKLPYLTAGNDIDLKRLPMAINSVLRTYRGVRVDIPEAAVPDVLVRLARAAKAAGRFDGMPCDDPVDCYQLLAVILEQEGRLVEVCTERATAPSRSPA